MFSQKFWSVSKIKRLRQRILTPRLILSFIFCKNTSQVIFIAHPVIALHEEDILTSIWKNILLDRKFQTALSFNHLRSCHIVFIPSKFMARLTAWLFGNLVACWLTDPGFDSRFCRGIIPRYVPTECWCVSVLFPRSCPMLSSMEVSILCWPQLRRGHPFFPGPYM